MRTVAKSRLIAVILSILLLCTTVPSATSCESAVGTGALVVVVIAVAWVTYLVAVYATSSPHVASGTCVDARSASISSLLPELIEQRQDLVISNELECAYEVYVDGAYRCTVGPLETTSLTVGIGSHNAALYSRPESDREPAAPPELRRQFEVLNDEGFAYAVIQYSY